MKALNIGILGASGAVGQEMLRILEEYDIPTAELRPLASARSAGKCVRFRGRDIPIRAADDGAFEGLDFVLGAVEGDMSQRFAPAIRRSGAVYIDNSSAFRLDPEVPLVVPEINGEDAFTARFFTSDEHATQVEIFSDGQRTQAAADVYDLRPASMTTAF